MTTSPEDYLIGWALHERPSGAGRGRTTACEMNLTRILGASPTAEGTVQISAIEQDSLRVLLALPVEAAMTLLNDLSRIAREDGWFTVA